MEKIDFKKVYKELFNPPVGEFVTVEVPRMSFVKIDGAGNPNTARSYKRALEWLYSVSYAMKFACKAMLGKDYIVPPLEGLWWADDPAAFVARRKDEWKWTMMIMAPDFLGRPVFDAAVAKSGKKLGELPATLRLEPSEEGLCLQTLHIGAYDDEGPVLAQLHQDIMPAGGFVNDGHHHEIYLSDARRVAPEKDARSCASRSSEAEPTKPQSHTKYLTNAAPAFNLVWKMEATCGDAHAGVLSSAILSPSPDPKNSSQ